MHTPGPWNFHAPIPSQGIKHYIVHEELADIAEVYAWDHTEATEANARLIAAAPELLEAVRQAINDLEHDGCGDNHLPGCSMPILQAVYAKATEKP